jgi:methylmalonyl-CoA mutase N-terminal domain/subunit
MIAAIERGYPQAQISQASYDYQRRIESGEQIIVGVNGFQQAGDENIDILQTDERARELQSGKLERLRAVRDPVRTAAALDALRQAAADERRNTMPYILEAVRASATLGEICEALRDVFGAFQESSVL